MKWFIFIFVILLSACESSGRNSGNEPPKEDPYVDSTLHSIKASQKVQIDQQMRKGY